MSQTHIITVAGGVYCGRTTIRGFITADEFRGLGGKYPIRIKTNVKHNCSKRPCGCPRRKEEIIGVCKECRRRVE